MKLFQKLVVFLFCFALPAWAQEQVPPLDGPHRTFQDELLSNLAGSWKMSGIIRGQNATHSVDSQWVLNHQFLQIHEKSLDAPADGRPAYEAMVMVGYDNASERYVAHWTDIYGGRVSETLGYGTRSGDQIEFVFEYPEGPFRTTFRWLADRKQWQWHMRTKNETGKWIDFADLILARRES
jgi:hypothetical protein